MNSTAHANECTLIKPRILSSSLNYNIFKYLQSHFIPTMSHWSSGLPVCFPSQETRVQIPWRVLMLSGILLLALSRQGNFSSVVYMKALCVCKVTCWGKDGRGGCKTGFRSELKKVKITN